MQGSVVADRYRIEEPLGVGAMGTVWLAEDLELGRRVALKLLGREADRARFDREARAAASLEHPNVCRLFDYGETDEGPFMVLELLPGGTLEERLRAGRLDDAETGRIARELAAGLAHAHERGLVHRDLKPGNVLFDAEGNAKIADFGVARLPGGGTLTDAGTIVGTAAYISPEQAAGEPATPASDVYALGVILYRLLTGRLPFEAERPLDLVAAHRDLPPPPLASVRPDAPPRLESVATAALAKRPEDRPADGAALLAELDAPAATAPLPAAPPRRPARALPAAVAALLLAAAGLGAAVLLLDPAPADAPTVGSAPRLPTTEATERATAPPPAPAPATTSDETTTRPKTTTEPATTARTTTTAPPTTTAPTTTTAPPPPPPPPTETATEPTTTTEATAPETTATTG